MNESDYSEDGQYEFNPNHHSDRYLDAWVPCSVYRGNVYISPEYSAMLEGARNPYGRDMLSDGTLIWKGWAKGRYLRPIFDGTADEEL